MADLSPAAQAVLDAAVLPCTIRRGIAAALRAAVEQVVPVEPEIPEGDLTEQAYRHDERYGIRAALLAIATELGNTPQPAALTASRPHDV
jgi:hypothetical protein